MTAGALLLIAGLGAALVHVAEYHVGLETVGGRSASLAFMLAHCPVRGGLLAAIVVALVALMALLVELRALANQRFRLTSTARCIRHIDATSLPATTSPQLGRLLVVFQPLLCVQLGLYALVERCVPMTVAMSMHGVTMNMDVRSTLPLVPVHLVVALLLAVFVWRLEHRIVVLQAAIDAVRRLLRQAPRAPRRVRLPFAPNVAQPSRLYGPGALSRPPPA